MGRRCRITSARQSITGDLIDEIDDQADDHRNRLDTAAVCEFVDGHCADKYHRSDADRTNGQRPESYELEVAQLSGIAPRSRRKTRIKKKKDGLFDEVTQTASRSWNRTKEVLNPQKLNPVNFFPASARTPSSKQTEKTEPGFFRSLFTPAEEPADDNATVTDFLRQSRPSP